MPWALRKRRRRRRKRRRRRRGRRRRRPLGGVEVQLYSVFDLGIRMG
jgi:hypothetical protein